MEKHSTFLSNLRLNPELRWESLGDLYRLPDKEQYSLKEWSQAVSYLLGCEVIFKNYQQVENSLKPFSLPMK